jgi:tight adherence protein C
MLITFSVALCTALFCGLSLLILFLSAAQQRRVSGNILEAAALPSAKKRIERESALISSLQRIREHFGISESAKVKERFVAAGFKGARARELYFVVRMLSPILALVAGSFMPSNTFFWVTVFAGLGYLAPEFWLERKVKRRRESIRRSLPDVLDLLVICLEAGLGIDQAILRTSDELSLSHPQICQELVQLNREQRAGKLRLEAWQGMADRIKLPDISSFVSMLTQTDRFGTPIVRALSEFSDGLRLKRKQVAEEKAAKTSVKMLFPLVLFIFPCIFIVLLGPAVISVSHSFSTMGQ